MVPNGGTMVIGGIVTADVSDSVQGVPILSDIPVLGWLFQRKQESEERRTLYIFLTPYILYDYNFGDFHDVTRERREEMERLRGEPIPRLRREAKIMQLPESTFRFDVPAARREE